MGNRVAKAGRCFCTAGEISQRHDNSVGVPDPLDEGFGHSFCYFRPDSETSSSKVSSEDPNPPTTTFRSISGASVSANTFTPLSTSLCDLYPYSAGCDRAARFESSTSFASIPLQPVPRKSYQGVASSGPIERGFLSGPIERGYLSGPIDRGLYSGPIEKECERLERSLSFGIGTKPKRSLMKIIRRAISSAVSRGQKSSVAPVKGGVLVKESDSEKMGGGIATPSSTNLSSHVSLSNENEDCSGDYSMGSQNLHWAQGKAGEDRVHVVVSEEHGWVFVGIYDGFNGPDAPDYLLSNLYSAVHKELKGLLWNDKFEMEMETESSAVKSSNSYLDSDSLKEIDLPQMSNRMVHGVHGENYALENGDINADGNSKRKQSNGLGNKLEETQRRWKCEWDRERPELDRKLKENLKRPVSNGVGSPDPKDVLKALSEALKKTEDTFLDTADKMVTENPELALMGSCVLVMLMKGDDVYLMNVGDSRAVLARKAEPNMRRNLERISEEPSDDLDSSNADESYSLNNLTALQLTMDHSTYVKEEVQRIKNEHPDDASAIMNDRVKGYLKVTRAFGAGFLKQPKWNDALLEMFRLNYVGTAPYLTCIPSVYHHKLSRRDRLLILSSDGLYQYFTNEEAVSEVELFISSFPEGDPAQHLIEEVLFRAAKKAGMAFHELLDIPQGERRRYHDDVSIIVISLEGRIWRSSV
ncbi:PREDICTED: probable protein phosphatase 2C 4 [Prunus mume]|uniref:Probable protein phosphatase 2C 4 n=1 Tax=Prunus mume TaxID=102107 RepID=A0ABM0PKP6_PRUMU|nr:PREDICTED: probable protein phosphatase 2C 4 [Prunus mume]